MALEGTQPPSWKQPTRCLEIREKPQHSHLRMTCPRISWGGCWSSWALPDPPIRTPGGWRWASAPATSPAPSHGVPPPPAVSAPLTWSHLFSQLGRAAPGSPQACPPRGSPAQAPLGGRDVSDPPRKECLPAPSPAERAQLSWNKPVITGRKENAVRAAPGNAQPSASQPRSTAAAQLWSLRGLDLAHSAALCTFVRAHARARVCERTGACVGSRGLGPPQAPRTCACVCEAVRAPPLCT